MAKDEDTIEIDLEKDLLNNTLSKDEMKQWEEDTLKDGAVEEIPNWSNHYKSISSD